MIFMSNKNVRKDDVIAILRNSAASTRDTPDKRKYYFETGMVPSV